MKKTSYNELIDILRFLPQTSKIRGGIFQQSAHHHLRYGGSFELQSLDGSDENLTLTVPPGIYREVQSHHCASVAAVVVMNNTVLLFQPTVGNIHAIDGHEILHILKSVEKFDDFVNGINVDVLLIFVIPKGIKNFERQQINPIEFNHDDCSVGRVGSMRHSWRQELVRNNVTTVKDLRAYITDPNHEDREKYTKYIDEFDERNANSKYNDKLQRIRQYVVVLNEVDEQRNEDWLENLRNHIRELCEFA